MMSKVFISDNCKITLEKQGCTSYTKMSFPLPCGIYNEIETNHYILQFNLNGEILRAKGKTKGWAHPHEWLKRTQGNDWVYYSTGGYTGVFEATGEYYLPNFQYPTNSILGGHPFDQEEILRITVSWHQIIREVTEQIGDVPDAINSFLLTVLANNPDTLHQRAKELHRTIGNRISVLPPDARHVDYNLVPLTISNGCLYKCKFCKVKNSSAFVEKTQEEVTEQLHHLKKHYGKDLVNYNSLFLGEHDALNTKAKLILWSLEKSFEEFGLNTSYTSGSNIFLFGSVTSLLNAPLQLFRQLAEFPAMTYINIGLESADQETLDLIGKPISEKLVREAFLRSQEINDNFSSIEITLNFIMDEKLPENHYKKILGLIREDQLHVKPKGCVYFSPLTFDSPSRSRLFEFNRIKIMSRLPTYLYIIQRL